MGEASGNQEPTMEEILASIRRIISEDDATEGDGKDKVQTSAKPPAAKPREAAEERPRPRPPPEPEPEPEPEFEPEPEPAPVAVATAEPEDDDFDFEPEPVASFDEPEAAVADFEDDDEGEDDFEDDDVLELTDILPEPVVEVDLADDDPAPPPPRQGRRGTGEDGLVSPPTAEDALAAIGNLAAAVTGRRDMPLGGSARTLEEMVKELLRPMLKEWLDANLAAIVQRAVEREVARIANRTDDFRR